MTDRDIIVEAIKNWKAAKAEIPGLVERVGQAQDNVRSALDSPQDDAALNAVVEPCIEVMEELRSKRVALDVLETQLATYGFDFLLEDPPQTFDPTIPGR